VGGNSHVFTLRTHHISGFLKTSFVDIGYRQMTALIRQIQRKSSSDAGRGSGNGRDFILKILHRCLLLRIVDSVSFFPGLKYIKKQIKHFELKNCKTLFVKIIEAICDS
jgi:hypothetical protein